MSRAMRYLDHDLSIDGRTYRSAFKQPHPHQDLLCTIVEAHDKLASQFGKLRYKYQQSESKLHELEHQVRGLLIQLAEQQQSGRVTHNSDTDDRSVPETDAYRAKYIDHFLAYKAGKGTEKSSSQEHGGSP